MNRDELIMACIPFVNRLVKKYNNHKSDEDLQQEGLVEVTRCVDRCLREGMTDENQIMARCNVWAKNRILNCIYAEKIKYTDDETAIELLEAPEDLNLLIMDIETVLTPRQYEVFDLLYKGYSDNEICTKLNIGKDMLITHKKRIKKKIKELTIPN